MSFQQKLLHSLSTTINSLSREINNSSSPLDASSSPGESKEFVPNSSSKSHNNDKSKSRSVICLTNNKPSSISTSLKQTQLTFSVLQKKRPQNPYPKPIKTNDQPISIQTKIQHSFPTDDSWIGSPLCPPASYSARIWIQNINGINISNNFNHFTEQLQYTKRYEISAFCLTETKVNAHNPYVSENVEACIKLVYPDSESSLTNSYLQSESIYQSGGVLCSTTIDPLAGRVASVGRDKYGRFSWIDFYGKSNFIRLYTVYRVNDNSDLSTGDTTAWADQRTLLTSKGIYDNPRKRIISDLLHQLKNDIQLNRNLIVCGDFNENVLSEKGTNQSFKSLGLINLFESLSPTDQKIRTHTRGKSIIDGIWTTSGISKNIIRMGIAPFNFMFPSDHRGMYIDLNIKEFLDNAVSSQPAPYRRLKSSIPRRVEAYGDKIDELHSFHKIDLKISQIKEIVDKLSKSDASFIFNKLDKEIQDILTCSEKSCSNVSRHCTLEFSDEMKKALRNHRQITHQLHKALRHSNQGSNLNQSTLNLIQEKRESHKVVTKCTKNQKELRNLMLDKLAEDKVKFCKDRQLKKSSVLKQLKNCETSKHDSKKINLALNGPREGGISYVLIPTPEEYSEELRNQPNFDHKNVDTIWERLNDPHWKRIKNWERIDNSQDVIKYTTHFLKRHFGQSNGTPFTSSEWIHNLSDENFQNSILKGDLPENLSLPAAAKDILFSFKSDFSTLREVPFLPTWNQFIQFISKTDEKTSASPSTRHYGHYKSLLLVGQPMLKSIFELLCLSLSKGIILDRWKNTITTLICKEKKKPYIHRLRPIHIVEVELQFISKYLWSQNLMRHAEKNKLITNSQYGGRKHRQAQSSVINTILSFDYHRQQRQPFTFNIDDLKANFDRELAHFSATETRSYGLPHNAGLFMIQTTQSQKFFIKTKAGISESYYSFSLDDTIWGLGQGISWAGVCWQFTATTLAKCLEKKCKGAYFFNPTNSIKLYQFLKFFIDDTNKICNFYPPTSDLITQNKLNMQYHANYVHATGGALALDKCSYYHIQYEFNDNLDPVLVPLDKLQSPVQIVTEYGPQSTIKQLNPTSSSKILGCLISPTGSSDAQLEELLAFAREWKSNITCSTLSPYLIFHSYTTIFLPKITYRLPTTSLTFNQCDQIMKILRPPLLHSFGIHEHFPTAILEAGPFYAGLGITHIYDLQGYFKLKFFKHHLLTMDETGDLLLIQLQTTQFELGRSTLFFNLDYSSNHFLTTPTWSSQIWEYISSRSLQMDFSLPILLPKQREHDEFLMDIIFHHYSKQELIILNKVRRHLKILFLSDITDIKGKSLLPFIRQGVLHRTSTLRWAPQPIKKAWLSLWNKACIHFQRQLTSCRLGTWICSHQTWPVSISHCSTYATTSYDPIPYIQSSHSSSCYLHPSHPTVIPTLPNVADYYPSKSGLIISSKIAKPPNTNYPKKQTTINSFFSFGQFERDNDTETQIVQAIQSNKAKMCADGSVKDEQGSFAYCLASTGSDILFQQHAPVHGDKHQITSTRCELMGLLACVKYLDYISTKYSFSQKHTILISADNQPAVTSTSKLRPSTKFAFIPDIDIIRELSSTIANSKFKIYLRHIKGHQNRFKTFSKLSPTAQLNVKMDTHAKLFFDAPSNAPQHNTFSAFLPSDIVSIRDPYSRIVTHFQHNLSRFHTGIHAEKHMSNALKISSTALNSLDWNNIRSALRTYKGKRKFNITRLIYQHLPTMQRNFKWNQASSPSCPLCDSTIEDSSHIFSCSHPQMQSFRNEKIQYISDQLQLIQTCPILLRHILCIIRKIPFARRPYKSICPKNDDVLLTSLDFALRRQHNIGLINFMHGILTYSLGDCQELYIKQNHIQTKLTGSQWNRRLILLLQQFAWSLWQHRCTLTSKVTSTSYESYLRLECKSTFFNTKNSNILPFDSRYLLDKKPHFFSKASIHNLSSWLRRIQTSITQAKQKCKTSTNDIRNWFPPTSSTTANSEPIPPSQSSTNLSSTNVHHQHPHVPSSARERSVQPSVSSHTTIASPKPQKIRPSIHKRRSKLRKYCSSAIQRRKPKHIYRHRKETQIESLDTQLLLTPPIPFQSYIRTFGKKNPPINPSTGK